MAETDPFGLDARILQANLEALGQADAHLAERLAGLAVADRACPARGRDGSVTFRLTEPDGQQRWFGRTSMPTISAAALLANFEPGGGNVALVGIGCGLEAKLLAQRMGPHQAIFVLETDPLKLALALRLYDLSGPIRQRRIVLLLSEQPEQALLEFCCQHDGFLPPGRMLSWPWLEPAGRQQATDMLSRAGKIISRRHQQQLGRLAELAGRHAARRPLPAAPRVVILSTSPIRRVSRLGQDLHEAARELGWASGIVLMDSPANANLLAHCRAAVEGRPDLLILIDHARRQLPTVPAGVPAVTWLSPHAVPDAGLVESMAAGDRCVASTSAAGERLLRAGLGSERVLVLPPAANIRRYEACQPDAQAIASARCDIAVIADAADPSPQACGIGLESHQALWRALTEEVRQNADRYHRGLLERLFARAEQRTGVKLSEAAVRRELIDRAALLLGPSLQKLATIQALLEAGIDVKLWGAGWDWAESLRGRWQGPLAGESQAAAIYRTASLVLHLEPDGRATQELFDALACGAAVLVRLPGGPVGPDAVSSFFDVRNELAGFGDRGELVDLAHRLLADPDGRNRLAEAAHRRVLEQHCYSHRLRRLHDWLVGQGR